MNRLFTCAFGYSLLLIISGCQSEKQEQKEQAVAQISDSVSKTDRVSPIDTTSIVLRESRNEEDVPVNDYLNNRLQPIRENFKRINSITKWSSIQKKDDWVSGELTFFYLSSVLEKIVLREFGKNYQQLSEYYFLNGELSFVFEKHYKYNPSAESYSSRTQVNTGSKQLDAEQAQLIEDRSYFEKGKLIHQINSQDCGSPFADDYLVEEQTRILAKLKGILAN